MLKVLSSQPWNWSQIWRHYRTLWNFFLVCSRHEHAQTECEEKSRKHACEKCQRLINMPARIVASDPAEHHKFWIATYKDMLESKTWKSALNEENPHGMKKMNQNQKRIQKNDANDNRKCYRKQRDVLYDYIGLYFCTVDVRWYELSGETLKIRSIENSFIS